MWTHKNYQAGNEVGPPYLFLSRCTFRRSSLLRSVCNSLDNTDDSLDNTDDKKLGAVLFAEPEIAEWVLPTVCNAVFKVVHVLWFKK